MSAYAVFNGLFGVTYLFLLPCYAVFTYSETAGGVFERVGELVHHLWYPNSQVLYVGAKGSRRYAPDTKGQVLKGACFACPSMYEDRSNPQMAVEYYQTLVTQDKVVYGDEYQVDPYAMAPLMNARKDCVRVGASGTPKLANVKGPPPMSAKEYIVTQLFGSKWKQVYQSLYGTDNLADLKPPVWGLQAKELSAKLAGRWNKTLFAGDKSPFPMARVMPEAFSDAGEPHYNDESLTGHYTWNGKQFIPPKLWHWRGSSDPKYQHSYSDYYTVTSAPFRETDSTFFDAPHYPRGSHADTQDIPHNLAKPRDTQQQQVQAMLASGTTNPNAQEIEWWYAYDSASGQNVSSALCSWTEDQCQHYVTNFMVGAGAPRVLYVPQ